MADDRCARKLPATRLALVHEYLNRQHIHSERENGTLWMSRGKEGIHPRVILAYSHGGEVCLSRYDGSVIVERCDGIVGSSLLTRAAIDHNPGAKRTIFGIIDCGKRGLEAVADVPHRFQREGIEPWVVTIMTGVYVPNDWSGGDLVICTLPTQKPAKPQMIGNAIDYAREGITVVQGLEGVLETRHLSNVPYVHLFGPALRELGDISRGGEVWDRAVAFALGRYRPPELCRPESITQLHSY